MARRRRYSPEQIITKLREVEVLLSQGEMVAQACKKIEVSEQTYYRWRRDFALSAVIFASNTLWGDRCKLQNHENIRISRII